MIKSLSLNYINYILQSLEMDEEKKIRQKLATLEDEHRKLDDKINNMMMLNPLELQRMKKQKLSLKDQISKLYDILYPDIIA
jgi:hypothetical protein